jgi:hypothetical protein
MGDEQCHDEEAIRRDRLNRATTGAQTMAEKYFKTEYELVTKAKNIGRIKVTLSKPELIEGWNNRWTVRGKCEVQYNGEVVRVYPVTPQDQSSIENSDHTPYDITQYSTKVQDFEAIYSAETETPTFDVTLR